MATVKVFVRYRVNGSRKTTPAVFAAPMRLAAPPARGVFWLRWYADGRQVWKCAGTEPDKALMLRKKHQDEIDKATASAAQSVSSPAGETLRHAIEKYKANVLTVRGNKAYRRVNSLLEDFSAGVGKTYLDEITRDTLMDFQRWLKDKGRSPKTIRDRLSSIQTFLLSCDIPYLLKKGDMPKVIKRLKDCYTVAQIEAMLAVATPDERFLILFLLHLGVREQEAAHAEWSDFNGNSFNVTAKPTCRCAYCEGDGFKIKDCEERTIPDLPDVFMKAVEGREKSKTRIFSNKDGGHEGHMLRLLQGIGLRAGLNCGKCVTSQGQSCAKYAVCRKVGCHKFRRTFATWHHVLGHIPLSKVQEWLGHGDVATTMLYIARTEVVPGLNRKKVEATWSFLKPAA
jgi:integrase/recombinase XerD